MSILVNACEHEVSKSDRHPGSGLAAAGAAGFGVRGVARGASVGRLRQADRAIRSVGHLPTAHPATDQALAHADSKIASARRLTRVGRVAGAAGLAAGAGALTVAARRRKVGKAYTPGEITVHQKAADIARRKKQTSTKQTTVGSTIAAAGVLGGSAIGRSAKVTPHVRRTALRGGAGAVVAGAGLAAVGMAGHARHLAVQNHQEGLANEARHRRMEAVMAGPITKSALTAAMTPAKVSSALQPVSPVPTIKKVTPNVPTPGALVKSAFGPVVSKAFPLTDEYKKAKTEASDPDMGKSPAKIIGAKLARPKAAALKAVTKI